MSRRSPPKNTPPSSTTSTSSFLLSSSANQAVSSSSSSAQPQTRFPDRNLEHRITHGVPNRRSTLTGNYNGDKAARVRQTSVDSQSSGVTVIRPGRRQTSDRDRSINVATASSSSPSSSSSSIASSSSSVVASTRAAPPEQNRKQRGSGVSGSRTDRGHRRQRSEDTTSATGFHAGPVLASRLRASGGRAARGSLRADNNNNSNAEEGIEYKLPSTSTARIAHSNNINNNNNNSNPPLTSRRMRPEPVTVARVAQPNTARGPPSSASMSTSETKTSSNSSSSTRERSSTSRRVVNPGITPAEAIRKHRDLLTPFEQSEILGYKNIYFVGHPKARKINGVPNGGERGSGYDDSRGDYKFVTGDHLEYRYEVLGVLGKGSFGQVIRAVDHKKNCNVAVKVIRNKKKFYQQAMVEIKILEQLMRDDYDHRSNVVRVYGYFYFRNHFCITFEVLSMNLYELIKQSKFRGLQLTTIKKFAVQIITCLDFLAKHRVIHCDIKPENILLQHRNRGGLRMIDFGSSCYVSETCYAYIQSRFYRAPEVILGLPYGLPIDMWSFGCVLFELYTGMPLFSGENEHEQLMCMMEILGHPPRHMVSRGSRRSTFFENDMQTPVSLTNSRGKVRKPNSKTLASVAKCQDMVFIAFLTRCLEWDPDARMTPRDALIHPWILSA